MKKTILFTGLYFFVLSVFAQTEAEKLHTKYWYLKNRLNKYFIVIGDDYNQSIPATIRNRNDASNNHSGAALTTPGDLSTSTGFSMDYTDAPQQIALYIATLATEYKLLKLNNQNTNKVISELYYALYAFNRLDDCENEYPWVNCDLPINYFFSKNRKYQPDANTLSRLDGKMLRGEYYRGDDSDLVNFPGFVDKYNSQLNDGVDYYYYTPDNKGIPYGNPKRVFKSMTNEGGTININFNEELFWGTNEEEIFSGNKVEKLKSGAMMSQDHYSKVLFGLAFVVKFIDQNENYQGKMFQDGEISIKIEAAKIAHRICNSMASDDYLLKRPDGVPLLEKWGGDARSFSYGFAAAGKWIVEQAGLFNLSNNYFNTTTSISEALVWSNFAVPATLNVSWRNSLWIYLSLACVSNNSSDLIAPSNFEIYKYSVIPQWHPFYTLAHSVLHNKACFTDQSTIEQHLSGLRCEGPYNFGDVTGGGWCTPRRYHNDPNDCNDHLGNFNGLEWMLLYNMYLLREKTENTGSKWAETKYMDLMDRTIDVDFPFNVGFGIQLGTSQLPVEINAFNSINYSGTVNTNSSVSLRAGFNVNLNTNASLSQFTQVYTKPIVCNNGSIPTISIRKNNTGDNLISSNDLLIPNKLSTENNTPYEENVFENDVQENVLNKGILENKAPFPNPFENRIIINSIENNIVYVVNSNGSEVYRAINVQEINTKGWESGYYVLCVINEKGETHSYKIVKN